VVLSGMVFGTGGVNTGRKFAPSEVLQYPALRVFFKLYGGGTDEGNEIFDLRKRADILDIGSGVGVDELGMSEKSFFPRSLL